MQKKHIKLGITLIVFAIILGALYIVFAPKEIFSDEDNVSIVQVFYLGEEIDINEQEVLNILRKYKIRRSVKDYFPYQKKDVDFEIFLIQNYKSRHILIGEINILYDSGLYPYIIIDNENLKKELLSTFHK